MSLEQNQQAAMRAWEEFGKPLAGSTIGNPPRQDKFKPEEDENLSQQEAEEQDQPIAMPRNQAA